MSNLIGPSRGEIWDLEWENPRGSEQAGRRPSLIVQNDAGNRSQGYQNTIAVAMSSSGKDIPLHIPIKASRLNGLRNDSFVKCEHMMTVSKERLVGKHPRGRLSDEQMGQVEAALRKSLGL